MTVNKVILVGNLGQDPEIRSTSDGKEIATFSIATTESWKDKNSGERKNKAEWHRVIVFSQGLIGIVKNYVKKGSKLYIEGQLQTRKWTDNNGVDKYKTEIVLQNYSSTIQMLDSRNSSGSFADSSKFSAPNNNQGQNQNSSNNNTANNVVVEELDDDIPFGGRSSDSFSL